MPIYEYLCKTCNKSSSFLLLRITEAITPYCKFCGNKDVTRILSSVSLPRSYDKRMEGLLSPSRFSDLDENDPRSIERFAKETGKELGDELGENFEESMNDALNGAGRPAEVGS